MNLLKRYLIQTTTAITLLTMFILAEGATAQGSIFELVPPEGTLSFNREARGALSSSDFRLPDNEYIEVWTFEGRAGQDITIDLMTDQFDSYLYLTGPGFNETISDDDSGAGCDARITETLLESGTYYVAATSLSSGSTGTYRILLSDEAPAIESYECGEANPEAIRRLRQDARRGSIGELHTGTLTQADPVVEDDRHGQAWTVRGREGDVIEIDLQSDDFDTYLFVAGPEGDDLLTDDDGGEDTNSRIAYTFREDGEVLIIASAFSEDSEGTYTLRITEIEITGGGEIEIGNSYTGFLTSMPETSTGDRGGQIWTIYGERGQTVRISMRSEDFDTYLYLDGPGLDSRLSDDDGGGGTDSEISVTFPSSGEYEITAAAFGSDGSGSYTIEVRESIDAESAPVQGTLRSGRTETGWLSSDDPAIYDERPGQVWEIDGEEGRTIEVEIWGDFDTYLYIMGPGMDEPRRDDDSGEGNGSRLVFTFPETGTYRAIVSGYSTSAEGEYSIRGVVVR